MFTSNEPGERRHRAALVATCLILAGCGAQCDGDDDDDSEPAAPLDDESADEPAPIDDDEPGDDGELDDEDGPVEPDAEGKRCVDVKDGAGWWSITEKLGLDPNRYWGYVRDLNDQAQVQDNPDHVVKDSTVCLTAAAFAAPVASAVPEVDEELEASCAPHLCVVYSSLRDSGGAEELAEELPTLATLPMVVEATEPADAAQAPAGDDSGDGLVVLEPSFETFPPLEVELPELTSSSQPATDVRVSVFVELFNDHAWEEIIERYEADYGGSAITVVETAAIVAIADLAFNGELNEVALNHYRAHYEALVDDASSDLEGDLVQALCAALPTCGDG